MTASDLIFVDTNVLLYARDQTVPSKHAAAQKWMGALRRTGNWRISYQVVHEYYDVFRRKLAPGLSLDEARKDVRDFLAWGPLAPNPAVVEAAWAMQDVHRLSWWDGLILGAAKVGGCAYLLSEDLSAGHNYNGVRVINPFATEPAEVLR